MTAFNPFVYVSSVCCRQYTRVNKIVYLSPTILTLSKKQDIIFMDDEILRMLENLVLKEARTFEILKSNMKHACRAA